VTKCVESVLGNHPSRGNGWNGKKSLMGPLKRQHSPNRTKVKIE